MVARWHDHRSGGRSGVHRVRHERSCSLGHELLLLHQLWPCHSISRLQGPLPEGAFRLRGAGAGANQVCEVATVMDGGGGGTEPPTWRWRRGSAPPSVAALLREHKAVVNGVVYFMPRELEIDRDLVDDEDDIAQSWNRIAAFDLESEEWKAEVINGPALGHQKEEEAWAIALVELKGTVSLVQDVDVFDGQNHGRYMSIWLLIDRDKSVWVKECTMEVPKNLIRAMPLGALVDGTILLLVTNVEEETRHVQED